MKNGVRGRRNRKTLREDMELLEVCLERMKDAMKVGESTLDRLRVDRNEWSREVSVCVFLGGFDF